MANISKYTFDEVEARLDAIKFDQGQDKVLLGNGTYGNLPTGETSYDDTEIQNKISDVETALENKADKTELNGLATETYVAEQIANAQLSGGEPVDETVIIDAVNDYMVANPVSVTGQKLVSLPTEVLKAGYYWNKSKMAENASSDRVYACYDNSDGSLTGKTIFVSGYTGGASTLPVLTFADESNVYIGGYMDSANTAYTDLAVEVPDGTYKIYVNGYKANPIQIKVYKDTPYITDTESGLESAYMFKAITDVATIGCFSINMYAIDASIISGCCLEYPIPENVKKLKISGAMGSATPHPFYTFTDDNNGIIEMLRTDVGTKFYDIIVDVPENATKIFVNGSKTCAPSIQTQVSNTMTDLTMLPHLLTEFGSKLQYNDTFAWKPMDTGYFAFTYDDSKENFDLIVDLFEEIGAPCCFGVIPDRLNAIASQSTGETILSAMLRCQANGGEILNHEHEVVTADNIDNMEMMYHKFFIAKRVLIDSGLKVRGIVRAGGEGEIDKDPRTDAWVRLFYDYSDLYGVAEPYNHERKSFASSSLDNFKAHVDSVIQNKEFCPFLFHDIKGLSHETNGHLTADETRELIEYIQEKGGIVTTYSHVYDTFGSTVDKEKLNDLETRIAALEG